MARSTSPVASCTDALGSSTNIALISLHRAASPSSASPLATVPAEADASAAAPPGGMVPAAAATASSVGAPASSPGGRDSSSSSSSSSSAASSLGITMTSPATGFGPASSA